MPPAELNVKIHVLTKGLQSIADEVVRVLNGRTAKLSDNQERELNYCSVFIFNDGTERNFLKSQIYDQRYTLGHRVLAIYLNETPLDLGSTWELMESGAQEVLNWRALVNPQQVLNARLERWSEIEAIVHSSKVKESLVGTSLAWKSMLRELVEAIVYSQSPILILGESGTGKELVARLIHQLDKRSAKREMILLDCSTISPELSGSEFFGHEKGAFTHALSSRDGVFSQADNGTLFLDEIGELPPRMQAELLRVIQEGSYKRVGGNSWYQTNFRLVCATNRNLEKDVKKKRFRQDLFHRISGWVFRLPPLRERREDIPELVRFFFKKALKNEDVPSIDPAVMSYLETREYKGNLRELRQLTTRIAAHHVGPGPVTVGDIAEVDRNCAQILDFPLRKTDFLNGLQLALRRGLGLKEIVADVSDAAKNLAIRDAEGNLQLAAQILKVTDRTLQQYQAVRREKPDQYSENGLDAEEM